MATTQREFLTREGTIDDMRENWLWWNDSTTRKMMRTAATVSWEDHVAWFESILQTPDRYLCMFEDAISKIGVVRFDPKDTPIYEVSINLNPLRRGQGFGAALIEAGIKYVVDRQQVEKFIAAVNKSNIASVKTFLNAGFSRRDGLTTEDVLITRGLDPDFECYFERTGNMG